MPKRPREHQLEAESRVAFEAALPSRLVYRTLDHDYGLDGEVEEFDESGEATGLRFFVQLKATDQPIESKALRVRVPLETAAYYRAQPVPVLMVRHMASTGAIYTRWFHDFDPYYEHVGDSHVTFNWSPGDKWTDSSPERLLSDARKLAQVRAPRPSLPLAVSVEVPAGKVWGLARAEVELAVRGGVARCPEVLRVVHDVTEALLSLKVEEETLTVRLSGLQAVTIHLDETYDPGDAGETLASDLLAGGAVTLARAGHAEPAARLGSEFFAASRLAHVMEAALELASAMAYARRASDALALAEALEQSDSKALRANGFALLLPALDRPESLNPAERNELVGSLERRIERRRADGDLLPAARLAANLGATHLTLGDGASSVRWYEEARALEGSYEQEPGYWRALGGAYFFDGQPLASADAYARAVQLVGGPDPATEARWADALFRAGRYEEALDKFAPIGSEDPSLDAWATAKRRSLLWIIEATGLREQERRPEEAEELAEELMMDLTPADLESVCGRIWALDAASALGWFNRARHYLNHGDERSALLAYLTTAVMQEGDVEAWANVTLLAFNTGDYELYIASIIAAASLNAELYVHEVARVLRASIADPDRREMFLGDINRVVEEHDALPSGPIDVKFELEGADEQVWSPHRALNSDESE